MIDGASLVSYKNIDSLVRESGERGESNAFSAADETIEESAFLPSTILKAVPFLPRGKGI
jgi:hypothetical protein